MDKHQKLIVSICATRTLSEQQSAVSRQLSGTGFGLRPRCANDAVT
ncbi:hypothetical protein [Moorena sp. SIO4A5]|nr:hypothetical protein [Moorena sp. SIO4A5]